LDERADPSKGLAPPIIQLLDSRIDPLRGSTSSCFFLRAALLHGRCRFLHGCRRSPVTCVSLSALPRELLNASDRSEFRVVSEFWADIHPTQESPHDRFGAVRNVQVPMAEPMQHTFQAR